MITFAVGSVKGDKSILQFLGYLRHSGVFHLFQGQAMWLEGAMAAHHVSYLVCQVASQVK
jgi:hypothetical protein